MTPKEKADDLLKIFDVKHQHRLGFPISMHLDQTVQCAIICVDEIIKSNPVSESTGVYVRQNLYWNDVKDELIKNIK